MRIFVSATILALISVQAFALEQEIVVASAGFSFHPIEGWKTKIISDFYGKPKIMLERKEIKPNNKHPITIITLSVEKNTSFASNDKVKTTLFLSKPKLLILKSKDQITIDRKPAELTRYEATFEPDDVIPTLNGVYTTIPLNYKEYTLLVKGASEKWNSDKDFYILVSSIRLVD